MMYYLKKNNRIGFLENWEKKELFHDIINVLSLILLLYKLATATSLIVTFLSILLTTWLLGTSFYFNCFYLGL